VRGVDLVKHAVCAAAAKQIGHIRRSRPVSEPMHTHRRTRSSLANQDTDYLWCGANHYGKAIRLMAAEISAGAFEYTYTVSEEQRAGVPVSTPSATRLVATEARLMAACIMCQYEELSASHIAWARHLNGLYRLLRLDNSEVTSPNSYQSDAPSPAPSHPRGFRSYFWYFVQNDFEESCKFCPSCLDYS
jgi:hypothetical protein